MATTVIRTHPSGSSGKWVDREENNGAKVAKSDSRAEHRYETTPPLPPTSYRGGGTRHGPQAPARTYGTRSKATASPTQSIALSLGRPRLLKVNRSSSAGTVRGLASEAAGLLPVLGRSLSAAALPGWCVLVPPPSAHKDMRRVSLRLAWLVTAAAAVVLDDTTIRDAVTAWLADATAAEASYGHISAWDTSQVTDMKQLFQNSIFNDDISAWDTSAVTNMFATFGSAEQFDQPLNDWNVSGVTSMVGMFAHAETFNQPLDAWDVSRVTSLDDMFYYAHAFDQDLGWCIEAGVGFSNTLQGPKCGPSSSSVPQVVVVVVVAAAAVGAGHGRRRDDVRSVHSDFVDLQIRRGHVRDGVHEHALAVFCEYRERRREPAVHEGVFQLLRHGRFRLEDHCADGPCMDGEVEADHHWLPL